MKSHTLSMTRRWITIAVFALGACRAEETEMASEGATLYATHCADCHGTRALGDGPMAGNLPVRPPSLLEHLGHHPMDQLVQLIRTGVPPAMPPAALTDGQIRLVIDYTWSLVPDSLVADLREMQRQAEMGMSMDAPPVEQDPIGDAMPGMTHSDHMMPWDTTGN